MCIHCDTLLHIISANKCQYLQNYISCKYVGLIKFGLSSSLLKLGCICTSKELNSKTLVNDIDIFSTTILARYCRYQ